MIISITINAGYLFEKKLKVNGNFFKVRNQAQDFRLLKI